MKTMMLTLWVCAFLAAETFTACADGNSVKESSSDVTIYQVPWRCPAALEIGCGSHAKPILLRLEQSPGVSEAWLNRQGTAVAVVWKAGAKRKERKDVERILKQHEGSRMGGDAEAKALADFESRKGWYRGAEVDRLSEEEAGIIAARWVRRLRAKTSLADEKAEGLRAALADGRSKCLTGKAEMPDTKEEKLAALQRVAGPFLDEEQIKMLAEVAAFGMAAGPNEE